MVSNRRERELARARHERQQVRRAEARERARRRGQVVASALAVLAVLGAVFALTRIVGDGPTSSTPLAETTTTPDPAAAPSTSPSETPPPAAASDSPSPSASAAGGACAYTPTEGKPAARDVGVPTYDEKAAARPYTATLHTSQGMITMKALTDEAPCTTTSFRFLAEKKYFDKTSCHRLVTTGIFVLQCGDPTGTGSGGPGYAYGIENAPPDGTYPAGTVAMARTSDPNSNGSQFFIVYKDTQLPTDTGGYTTFGRVTKGLDVVEKVAKAGVGDNGVAPKTPVDIESVTIAG